MVGDHQNLNGSCDITTPHSGAVTIRGLAHATINILEVSIYTYYKDMKSDTKCQNGVVLGKSLKIVLFDRANTSSY